jgi:hypothetical protein
MQLSIFHHYTPITNNKILKIIRLLYKASLIITKNNYKKEGKLN